MVAELFGSQVVKKGLGDELALSKDIWPKHPCCIFVLKEDVIEKNEDVIYELIGSLVKSGRFILENPEEASKIGAKFLNQEVDIIKKVLTEPKDRIMTDELLPVLKDLDKIQVYMPEEMNIGRVKIDVEKFVDSRFA